MKGRLTDLAIGLNGRQRVTIELDRDFRGQYEQLKDQLLDVEIKRHREKRSRNANAYFHILVNKIAAATGQSDSAVKKHLVIEYGALDRDEDGMIVGFKLPIKADVDKFYPYTRLFDVDEENGKRFNCWLVYKRTSDMDTSEMARLIDGAISEAKELGIETDTPEQLARYKEEWSRA